MFASAGKFVPPEITEEILSLLPPKSLGRFKSVSKTWRSLISDPKFIKNYINSNQCYQTTTKLIPVSTKYHSLHSVDLNEILHNNSNDDNVEIFVTAKQLTLGSVPINWKQMLGSCNGLVLAKDEKGMMYIMNPTTRQEQELFKLPPSPFEHPAIDYSGCCGFGYDSLTDDYKVVWMSYTNNYLASSDLYLSVYSLRKNSWKTLPNPPYGFYDLSGALVNHKYHWPARIHGTILVFGLADEVFSEIKLPNLLQNQIWFFQIVEVGFFQIVEVGGKLGLFMGVIGDDSHLWVMDEYGNSKSWARIFSSQKFFAFPIISPVCLVEGSNRYFVMEDDEDEVAIFNIDEKRSTNVRIAGGPYRFDVGSTFVESIESPKRITLAP